jgi:hypothetical protein
MTNNFIGIYENVLPESNCQQLIDFFENCDKLGLTRNRQEHERSNKLEKDDDGLFILSTATSVLDLISYDIIQTFSNVFWSQVYTKYADEYAVLASLSPQQIYTFKMQRTKVGGGYHVWHGEQNDRLTSDRVLAFTCYLNDVAEGGETEFLYYPKRVPATQGTFLLFPGGFTHAHRGNPPISNTKYIITGWVQFCS